jgi:hypothetical protein
MSTSAAAGHAIVCRRLSRPIHRRHPPLAYTHRTIMLTGSPKPRDTGAHAHYAAIPYSLCSVGICRLIVINSNVSGYTGYGARTGGRREDLFAFHLPYKDVGPIEPSDPTPDGHSQGLRCSLDAPLLRRRSLAERRGGGRGNRDHTCAIKAGRWFRGCVEAMG